MRTSAVWWLLVALVVAVSLWLLGGRVRELVDEGARVGDQAPVTPATAPGVSAVPAHIEEEP